MIEVTACSELAATTAQRGHDSGQLRYSIDKARGDGLKSHQGTFKLDIKNDLFSERVVRHWHRLPRDLVESPSLEMFKKHRDVTLKDVVNGHCGDGMMVGLEDFRSLFQP